MLGKNRQNNCGVLFPLEVKQHFDSEHKGLSECCLTSSGNGPWSHLFDVIRRTVIVTIFLSLLRSARTQSFKCAVRPRSLEFGKNMTSLLCFILRLRALRNCFAPRNHGLSGSALRERNNGAGRARLAAPFSGCVPCPLRTTYTARFSVSGAIVFSCALSNVLTVPASDLNGWFLKDPRVYQRDHYVVSNMACHTGVKGYVHNT